MEAVDILLKGTMSWGTMLKSAGCRADVREYTKAPALHPAAYHGHTEICSLLFNAGAEVRGLLVHRDDIEGLHECSWRVQLPASNSRLCHLCLQKAVSGTP